MPCISACVTPHPFSLADDPVSKTILLKKTNAVVLLCRGGMATPEDHALRAALVGFSVGLFGDHRTILRRQPDTSVKVDNAYFIRYLVCVPVSLNV